MYRKLLATALALALALALGGATVAPAADSGGPLTMGPRGETVRGGGTPEN